MTRRDIVIDVLEFRNPADVQLGKGQLAQLNK